MTTAEIAAQGQKFGRYRNPIFQRELITLLRSRKSFALLLVYLAVSTAMVLISWPREASSLLMAGAISREVFSIFALGQTLLIALLIPAMLGTSMTMEKEGETIDLLLTTPVSGNSILLGKLMSGLSYFPLLALVSVPVLLLCFVIGGLSAQDVFGLYLFLFVQALVYGLTSVCCSTFFHRTHIAVILSYVFVAAEAVILKAIYGDGLDFFSSGRLAWLLVVSFPVLLILFLVTRYGVRRPYTPVTKPMEEEDVSKSLGLIIRRDSYPDKLIVPARRTTLLKDGVNPVLDKELQAGIYGAGSLFVRIVIQMGMILSLGAFFWALSVGVRAHLNPEAVLHPEYIFFCFIIGYMMTIGPSLAARTFTYEREERTIEPLMITLLPRSAIVWGKYWAILRVVGALTLLNTVTFLIIIFFTSFHFSQLLIMALVIQAVTVFATALAMFLSLACRTTLVAMISTYFILFVLYLGPVLVETYLTRLFPGVSIESFGFLTYVSPFLACRLPAYGADGLQLTNMTIHFGASVLLAMPSARR